MQLMLKYPPTPEAAPRHAALCVHAALTLHDVALDYSVESLRRLDGLIELLREQRLTSAQLGEVLFAFGCYVGEIFVRHAGGRWCMTEGLLQEGYMGLALAVQLTPRLYCNPVGKVFKRLELGAEHELPGFYARFASNPALESLASTLWN